MSDAASPTELTRLALQRLEEEIDDARWQELLRRHGPPLEAVYQEHARIGQALAALPRPAADPQLTTTILTGIPWRAAPPPRRFWRPSRVMASALVAACVVLAIVLDHELAEPPPLPPAVHQFVALAEHAPAEVADLPRTPPAAEKVNTPDGLSQDAARMKEERDRGPSAAAVSENGAANAGQDSSALAANTPAPTRDLLGSSPPGAPAGAAGAPPGTDGSAPAAMPQVATLNDQMVPHDEASGHAMRTLPRRFGSVQPDDTPPAAAAPAPAAPAAAPATAATAATANDFTVAVPAARIQGAGATEMLTRQALPPEQHSADQLRVGMAAAARWSYTLSLSLRPQLTAEILISTTDAGILPRGALAILGLDAQGRSIWRAPGITPLQDLAAIGPYRIRMIVRFPPGSVPPNVLMLQVSALGATSPSVAIASALPPPPPPAPLPGH